MRRLRDEVADMEWSDEAEDAAEALAIHMSNISEDYYCAGWLMDLERTLWAMAEGGDRRFGLGTVTEDEIATLRSLSERAGGWIVWRDRDGTTEGGNWFVTLAEWAEMYGKGRR